MNPAEPPFLLSIAEACLVLGIGRSKLYELIADGSLPLRKIGRKSLIARADLVELVSRLPVVKRSLAP